VSATSAVSVRTLRELPVPTPGANPGPREEQAIGLVDMIRPSQERVFRLALRITRNAEDAEDVRQETFLKVHRKLNQFEGRSRFTTWISRIAINEALMCLRKRRTAFFRSLEEGPRSPDEGPAAEDLPSPMEDPETAYSRRELRDALTSAVALMRPANRAVFLLRELDQRSTAETARALGISSSAVKARMRRARNELRATLRKSLAAPTGQATAA
jgi:RNA polymerase sigma-70 factor (ECF subfamily)